MRTRDVAAGLFGILAALNSLPARAASQAIESLQGLPPVVIKCRVEAPISAGIGESDLQKAVELRLSSARIRIEGPPDIFGSNTRWSPILFITVGAPSGDLKMYFIDVSVGQLVKPVRPGASAGPTLLLTTWSSKDRTGMLSNGVPIISTRDLVEKAVDEFISAYREANPKEEK